MILVILGKMLYVVYIYCDMTIMTGSSSDDWILLALRFHPLVITLTVLSLFHRLFVITLHANPHSLFPIVFITTLSLWINHPNLCHSQTASSRTALVHPKSSHSKSSYHYTLSALTDTVCPNLHSQFTVIAPSLTALVHTLYYCTHKISITSPIHDCLTTLDSWYHYTLPSALVGRLI
jgi:hypothetical protein